MTEIRPGFAGFEHLVPGWKEQVCKPYNEPVERGLAASIERLMGSRFIVATLIREYDYDGLFEKLVFDAGFVDPVEAFEAAQCIGTERINATLEEHKNEQTPWRLLGTSPRVWPTVDSLNGRRILSLISQKVGDGTGFNSREIHMAVFPVEPDRPITAELLAVINQPMEVTACF
jgi:hypothetical protein